ncbi:MAG: hypothetical protein RQ899_14590 [Pseudomonadales bacterium]|nr:hypothetical protein [Pseudomonadales bacterium]
MSKILTLASLLLCLAASVQAQTVDRPVCTRTELETATTAYVEAQGSGDLSSLALADEARYLENMIAIRKDEGLWNTALPIALTRSFHDTRRCKTFTEMIVTEGNHPYVIGTRLYLHEGKIIRVDSLVTDEGDWLFNANAYLKYASKEDWGVLPAAQRTSMQAMINGANSYLDMFSDKHVEAPWGRPCERLEGGAYTNRDGDPDSSCEVGIPAGVLYIVNRDYLVDEEMGVINVFCRFGNSSTGMPDSHTFRYVNGKFRSVHTLSVNLNPNAPSPQADDNGVILR